MRRWLWLCFVATGDVPPTEGEGEKPTEATNAAAGGGPCTYGTGQKRRRESIFLIALRR